MKIEIVVATDGGYEQHTGVMLASLFKHNKAHFFKVHLLHSKKALQIKTLIAFIKRKGHDVAQYEMAESMLANFKVTHHISLATYFRLFIPQLLPQDCHRILYLDSDMVVLADVGELWSFDLGTCFAAGVPDSFDRYQQLGIQEGLPYFNAGVMLWNLEQLRVMNFTQRAITYLQDKYDEILFWDQDVINYLMQGRVAEIDKSWNVVAGGETNAGGAKIIHYAGSVKPWNFPQHNGYDLYYFKYLLKTPWGYKCFTNRDYIALEARSLKQILS